MDPLYRQAFNTAFTDDLYREYVDDFSSSLGVEFEFRLAETPVFLPIELREKLVAAGDAIIEQLSERSRIERMKQAIPSQWDTPGMDHLPNFAQIDFAIVCGSDGELTPKLIELQGFPSLTAMELFQTESWTRTMKRRAHIDANWSCRFSGLDRESFIEHCRKTIVGQHDPQNVILMDLDPPRQKTYPDFVATKRLFDVDAVCPTTLTREGRTLLRRLPGGRRVEVRRIYNRVVFDELMKSGTTLPFDFREELDVEWAPHPNWYWVWSKYSLPMLDHPAVPAARLLSDLDRIPDDLTERYVLKPLFSFAGGGVNVKPAPADIEAIPENQRHQWCIQEKIDYAPALEAVDGGGVKVEIRLMYIRPDQEPRPIVVQNLCRLSRGVMHGVDFNKEFTWVGSSVGIWVGGE